MKPLLWALVVVAFGVLLRGAYFDVRAVGYPAGTPGVLTLLVGTVSVVVWLGFGRTLRRIVLAVVGRVLFNPESRDVRD